MPVTNAASAVSGKLKNITADDGVPTQRATKQYVAPRNPDVAYAIDRFKAFRPGQSFFVEGVTMADMSFLRRPFAAAGLGYTMREVEVDEIYHVAGVRVWRQLGEYDEL